MKFEKLFKHFPPPKFLDISFAGVAISDSSVHCVQFGKKNGALFIEKYAEKNIPTGTITSGQINNKEIIVAALSDLKKDLSLNYVKASLPEEKAYLFTARIPIVKNEEVISAIESKMEENVPVSGGELTFDYKLIDHNTFGHLDVIVSAIPITVVDSYVEIFSLAGLSLLSLEIESQAVTRALLPEKSLGTTLVVNFGLGKVGLYVATDRIVRFTSTVGISSGDSKDPNFLLHEIKKLYIYWHTLKENVDRPERKITQIVLCGENSKDMVTPYLSESNQTPVIFGSVWCNAFDINTSIPEISFSDSLKYAVAVGLALPSAILMQNLSKK
ncbi:MAG TPA: pilus assembly protein PilM [Candidatus Paceibacterota bacterium]